MRILRAQAVFPPGMMPCCARCENPTPCRGIRMAARRAVLRLHFAPKIKNAQSIFDDNTESLELRWLTGQEGGERSFSDETIAHATSSADLVGHLNLIHPNRIQVLGEAEILYYQRQSDEMRQRQIAGLIALEPPFLVV